MEKLNIAELLKDCPQGMELDCTLFEGLEFDGIVDNEFLPIRCRIKNSKGGYNIHNFTEYGQWDTLPYAKCVIFPKGKTTWEGFQRPFKDGDILFIKSAYSWVLIYKGSENKEDLHKYVAIPIHPKHTYIVYDNNPLCCKEDVSEIRFATEEEKQKLFDTIKANGYKWNAETKTLEKLVIPKFKVGDVIQDIDTYKVKITEVSIEDECYEYESMEIKGIGSIGFSEQDNWELVPNKFNITTLKPYDKVLVRCGNNGLWDPQFFAYYRPNSKFPFVCTYNTWSQCVPYEGNEHLLGTTDDCNEYFKTW